MEPNTRGARHIDMKPDPVLRVVALALLIAASGCASGNPGGTNAGGPVSPSVFISSPPEPAMSSTAGTAAVGGTCAPTDYSQPPIPYGEATASKTRSPLLPTSPDAALVCRYAGTAESHPAGTLVGYARANTTQAVALDAALNASVPVDTAAPPPSCPTNSGAVYTETFSYGDRGSATATSSLNGCAMTTVGNRTVWTSTAALNILATLVGEQPPATALVLGPQPSGGH